MTRQRLSRAKEGLPRSARLSVRRLLAALERAIEANEEVKRARDELLSRTWSTEELAKDT